MAEDSERRQRVADNIMAQACLPEVLVANGVHKAIHASIVEALEAEHTAGWNAAMGSAGTDTDNDPSRDI